MPNLKFDMNSITPFLIPIISAIISFYVGTATNKISADAKTEQLSKDVQNVNVSIEKFDNRFTNLESSIEKILIMNERFSNNLEFLDKRVTSLEQESKNK